jgi:hypothetical protein
MNVQSFSWIHEQVQGGFATDSASLNSLGFEIYHDNTADQPFSLPFLIHGSMTYEKHVFVLDGYLFDVVTFVSESSIFAVWFALSLVLSFLAWVSLYVHFRNSTFELSPIYWLGVLWHFSVDFSFIFEACLCSIDLDPILNWLLFLLITCLVVFACISFTAHLPGMVMDPSRRLYLALQLSGCMLAMRVAVSWVFEQTVVCSIALFSSFVPQIWSNTKRRPKPARDDWFSVLLCLSRLLLVWYFCFRDSNVKWVTNQTIGIWLVCHLITQVSMMFIANHFADQGLVQSEYGGLPGSGVQCRICMQDIGQGGRVLVTPCRHVYHRKCYMSCVLENLTCPVCRGEVEPPTGLA